MTNGPDNGFNNLELFLSILFYILCQTPERQIHFALALKVPKNTKILKVH